jgi:putative ABC transport system permease protein
MRILREAEYAVRKLSRTPGFTAVVILTLALGIGASTAVFSIVDAVLLQPLPYPQPERLVRITSELRGFAATDTGVSPVEFFDYQSLKDLFAGIAGLMPISANVTDGTQPERVEMLLVSWNYFAVLGIAPAHGRVFGREDDTPGVANIAVVSDGYWRRRLGADPAAVGRSIVIDGDRVLIVGVMPPGFGHPGRTLQNEVDVWSPAGFRNRATARGRRWLEGCLARLQPGVTLESAQTRLADYGASVSQQFPSEYPLQNGWRPRLVSLREDVVGSVATPMFMLLCGVGLLLLIACGNVAHLVLARSSERRHEVAIRQALGATRRRLTSELAIESVLLAGAGGVLGLLVASWALRGLIALAPARIPRIDTVSIDLNVVLVTALVSAAAALIFGLIPAIQITRGNTFAAVKEGGPGRTADVRAERARGVLVAAEVAMATVLLIGAGLLVQSVVRLLNVPVGFATDNLLTARVVLPRPNDTSRAAYLDPARRVAFYRETQRRIAALPGVDRVAMSSQIPMGGFNAPLFIELDGQDTESGRQPVVHHFQVSPGYFETMGIRILRGRGFTEFDRAGGEEVAIVSETAARVFWKGRDPIGERVRFAPGLPWITVVGVAGDVLNRRLNEAPQPVLYRSLEQSSDLTFALLVRTRGDVSNLGEMLAREVRAVDPELPVYSVRTMADLLAAFMAQRTFLMRLLVAFGVLATALALLGIYGVMAYSVSQRTREIGIRMAIGARQVDVSRMVMRRGILLTSTGAIAGVLASLGLTQLVKSQLFGVQPSDPWTMAAALILMTIVAAAAAYLPARRAARFDPLVALRQQ